MAKKKEIGYEEALRQLEALLAKVENEDIPIDQLTNMVDESMELLQLCKSKLKGTEDKIEQSFKTLEE